MFGISQVSQFCQSPFKYSTSESRLRELPSECNKRPVLDEMKLLVRLPGPLRISDLPLGRWSLIPASASGYRNVIAEPDWF